MNEEQRLLKIRDQIDALDKQIHELLNQRALAAQEVAHIKLDADPDAIFYRPEREAQVLRSVKSRNQGPLADDTVARLFREIMSACLALEKPVRVCYLGPEGTFSQAAALKQFGHAVHMSSAATISDVFADVENGAADYGVVPVENSTEGVVTHTLDTFISSPLFICGEVSIRINQNLMSLSSELGALKKIYSHKQSLAQCRGWLDRHLDASVERIEVSSNAEAARLAAEDETAAAIAGENAAMLYNLTILHNNIEDEPGNTTRFLIIGKQEVPPSGQDKTSLMLAIKNEAGGLYSLLSPLADFQVSMTRIESRPSRRGLWDYVFFIDVLGHQDDENVRQAFAELKQKANLFKVLGSYPVAVM